RFDVVGLGYCAVDYLGVVARYPELDEKIQILEFAKQGGGITATAMAAVGRLGGRAAYIGKIGDDDFGKFIIADLEKDGVYTSQVVVQPGASSQFSFIVVDQVTGKRTIFWTPSGMVLEPHEIKREYILSGKVLHMDAHHPRAAIQAASWANEAGIPVVMDAGSVREGSVELAERADCTIASALFAEQFAGEKDPERAVRRMFAGRRKLSAVTLGEKGCIYAADEGVFHQTAFKVDAVDTTGAGDVFHGAFSFGLAKGWPYREIIEFASAVAAIKCTKLGGRAGIPTLTQALDFLRTRSENEFWQDIRDA
ncbi:MAG TPA: PfkB family carbohydrate kinase, partial [Armatimonadota bacterium]|nr:PfkB family carbohydrate kinase [Armatimonadota bacterium]